MRHRSVMIAPNACGGKGFADGGVAAGATRDCHW
jgi:hypothetical protein